MSTFEHIVRAYEKKAGLVSGLAGAASLGAKAAWGGTKAVTDIGRGVLGFGARKGFAPKALHTAGVIGGLAAPVIGSSMAGAPNSGPSMNVGAYALGKSVQASLRETYGLDADTVSKAINLASYASMFGGAALHHNNPWHNRLEGAGLAGLGLTTLHSLATNPADRAPSAKDLAGLALFAWGLNDRMKTPHT